MMRNVKPNSEKKAMKIDEVAAVTRMSRNTRTSRSGWVVPRSRITNPTPNTAAPMNPAIEIPLVQPR